MTYTLFMKSVDIKVVAVSFVLSRVSFNLSTCELAINIIRCAQTVVAQLFAILLEKQRALVGHCGFHAHVVETNVAGMVHPKALGW